MNIRIQFSHRTVNILQAALQKAYAVADLRIVRRASGLIEFGANNLAVSSIAAKWDISRATFYDWLAAFLLDEADSLVYRYYRGRLPRLTPTQKKQLCDWIDAGPHARGCPIKRFGLTNDQLGSIA